LLVDADFEVDVDIININIDINININGNTTVDVILIVAQVRAWEIADFPGVKLDGGVEVQVEVQVNVNDDVTSTWFDEMGWNANACFVCQLAR